MAYISTDLVAKKRAAIAAPRRDLFINEIDRRIAALKSKCTEWAAKFLEDPAYEMEWSRGTFERAAQLWALEGLKREIDPTAERVDIAQLAGMLTKHVLNKSRSNVTSRSSSVTSNLMDDYKLAALSDLVQDFDGIRGFANNAASAEMMEPEE